MATKPLRALLSVWHKELVVPLAQRIHALGGELWASAGTAHFLQTQAALPVHSIESLTGFTALLGGRVKTLHPMIFAGLLARPEDPLPDDIPRWNLVAVELYPFDRNAENWVELIDIGGVSLLRAAAKNFAAVWAIAGPEAMNLPERPWMSMGDCRLSLSVSPMQQRLSNTAHAMMPR